MHRLPLKKQTALLPPHQEPHIRARAPALRGNAQIQAIGPWLHHGRSSVRTPGTPDSQRMLAGRCALDVAKQKSVRMGAGSLAR